MAALREEDKALKDEIKAKRDELNKAIERVKEVVKYGEAAVLRLKRPRQILRRKKVK